MTAVNHRVTETRSTHGGLLGQRHEKHDQRMVSVRPLCLRVSVVDVRHRMPPVGGTVAAVARPRARRRGDAQAPAAWPVTLTQKWKIAGRQRVRDADRRRRPRLRARPHRRAGDHHRLRRRDGQAPLERRPRRALQGEPGRRVAWARPQVLARPRQRPPLHVRHQRHPVVPRRRQRKGHLAQAAVGRAAALRRRDVADCRRRPAGGLHRRPRARRADSLRRGERRRPLAVDGRRARLRLAGPGDAGRRQATRHAVAHPRRRRGAGRRAVVADPDHDALRPELRDAGGRRRPGDLLRACRTRPRPSGS